MNVGDQHGAVEEEKLAIPCVLISKDPAETSHVEQSNMQPVEMFPEHSVQRRGRPTCLLDMMDKHDHFFFYVSSCAFKNRMT